MDRSAALCWGQRYVWLNHHQLPPGARHEVNLTISVGPGEGTTVESLRLGLDLMARRHEGLRSTYHADGGAGPGQRVHPPGPVPLVCYEAGEHSSAELAALVNDVTTADFDLEREWPVRACVVTWDSVPRRMVVVVHHTVMDDWSMETLKREADEIQESIVAGRRAALASVRHHPVDLARYEASAAAAPLRDRAAEHWRHAVRELPADVFGTRRVDPPAAGPADPPAGLSASLSSPTAMAAAGSVAARSGVWPSTVYATALTALLAAYTGSPTVAYRGYAANRDSAPHADVATCVFQPVLVSVDCTGDPTFAELLSRTAAGHGAALDASSRGPYDELLETVARHSVERGAGIRLGTVLNHLRYPTKVRGGTRTIVNRNPAPSSWALLGDDVYLRVCEWQDCVVATLNANPAVLDEAGVETFLRAFETVLVSAAAIADLRLSDIAADFGPVPARDGVVAVRGAWIDLDRVARVLAECPGVRAARVFRESTAAGAPRITAYVAAADPVVGSPAGPARLRSHLMGHVYDQPRLSCPDRFVVCAGVPEDPDPADAWSGLAVLAAGDGVRPAAAAEQSAVLSRAAEGSGCPAPAGVAEPHRALREAVREANGLDAVDLDDSYVVAGGRVMNIPRVQQLMRDHGWLGPRLYDLASGRPMWAVAASCRPAGMAAEPRTPVGAA